MSTYYPPGQQGPPTRPAARERWDVEDRLSEIEHSLLTMHLKMDQLLEERQDQREFRRWVVRLGFTAIVLLVLDALGLDASVLK